MYLKIVRFYNFFLHVVSLRVHRKDTMKHCHKECQKEFHGKMFNINNLLG